VAEATSPGDAQTGRRAEFRTFLIADVRGYTRYTQEHGDAASELAGRFAEMVRTAVPEFDGELIELRGDEALCVFLSPRMAIQAAVELQRRFRHQVDGEWVLPLGVGIGLDAGEAVPTEGGYRGRALNFAARLCAAAGRGEVLASEGLAHLAHPLAGVRFGPHRQLRLKGAESPVRVVAIAPETPLPPLPPLTPSAPSGWRRLRRRRFAAAALVVVAGVVALAASLNGDGRHGFGGGVPVHPNSVAVIDLSDGRVVDDLRVGIGQGPVDIAAGYGAVWVANTDSGTVSRIDPRTLQATDVATAGNPDAIAVGAGAVWAYDADAGRIYEIDRQGDGVVHRYRMPGCMTLPGSGSEGTAGVIIGCPAGRIAARDRRVWVGDGRYLIEVLDVATGRFDRVPGDAPAHAILATPAEIFTTSGGSVARIDPTTQRVSGTPEKVVDADEIHSTLAIAAAPDALWVASPDTGAVIRLNPSNLTPTGSTPLSPGLNGIAVGRDGVWVTNEGTGRLVEIRATSPSNVHPEHTERLGDAPTAATVAFGRLWVTVQDPRTANNQAY
jgi:class 3 adenylate cyclase/streptogramin lyase